MTKPKIANGGCLNPLMRLENRMAEYKKHHDESKPNCSKMHETHNKNNLELKTLLERKSKISDSKVKKKRSTNGTSINRKKTKIIPEKVQPKQFFDDYLEATPNVSLNMHSDIPDIDLDNFDMLKDANFSMSINEQELDGVLNNCCPQPAISNDLFSNQMSSEQIYSYKSSTQTKSEPVISNMNVNSFKMEENIQTPLFPPPEIPINSRLPSNVNTNVDYASTVNYITPNSNNSYATNIVPVTTHPVKSEDVKFNSNMYSVNVPINNTLTNQNAASYNYYNQMSSELPNSNLNSQYFYQYVNYPAATNYSDLPPTNNVNNFQLPTMSSGWYNNPPSQMIKQQQQPNCKPQLSQQFVNIPSTSANYHLNANNNNNNNTNNNNNSANTNNNYPHYQMNSHTNPNSIQCQQGLFNNLYDAPFPTNNNQSYNLLSQPNINMTSYNMMPDQNSYYYVDYSNVTSNRNGGTNNNNLSMITQNDTQFINNANICRNAYQSHCI